MCYASQGGTQIQASRQNLSFQVGEATFCFLLSLSHWLKSHAQNDQLSGSCPPVGVALKELICTYIIHNGKAYQRTKL